MATEQQLRALAPAEGKRIDIEKFCVSLAELVRAGRRAAALRVARRARAARSPHSIPSSSGSRRTAPPACTSRCARLLVRAVLAMRQRRARTCNPPPSPLRRAPLATRGRARRFARRRRKQPPAALGFGMSLPVGDRRPVALPRLPGKLSRYVPDPELRAQVEREYRINDQRIATDFRLKRPDEAPLLMSRLGG